MEFPNSWSQLRLDMINCEQTPGQNVLEHGQLVHNVYWDIGEILSLGTDDSRVKPLINKYRLPDWFFEYEWGLAWNRHSSNRILWYTTCHDLGKPYCREVDINGRIHFPNHSEVSFQVWNHLNRLDDFLIKRHSDAFVRDVGNLIRRDMEIHTIKAKDVPYFCRNKKEAVTLLLVGLSEIHANASMFGGIDSPSFKMKWKQINRRGRAICKFLNLQEQ